MKTISHGELELQVMDILWQSEKSSISNVYKDINKRRTIAYTTIATILQRLYDKGLVDRKAESNHYIYVPKLSKKDYSAKLVKNFISKLVNNFGDIALVHFVEEAKKIDKRKLKNIINEIKHESKS